MAKRRWQFELNWFVSCVVFACFAWSAQAAPPSAAPSNGATPPANARPAARPADTVPVDTRPNAPRTAAPKAPAGQTKNMFNLVKLEKRPLSPRWDYPYLLTAYGVVWLAVLIYLLSLANRMRSTDQLLQRVEKRLEALEKSKSS